MFANSSTRWRLGVVSYLNAKPLIAGLEGDPRVELVFEVPSRLADLLDRGVVDVALVPVIDLLRDARDWRILSDACIGCDGETLTVRVFSRIAPQDVRTLHVDGDSHASVALARIIWHEQYGRRLDIVEYGAAHADRPPEAILLIGDKVVNNRLIGYDIQIDLGLAWKSLTTLPFVFAAWAAPRAGDIDVDGVATVLSRARDAGVAAAGLIAEDLGPGLGWPVALARRYLTTRLKYTLGPRQREGMARFLALAKRYELASPTKELVFA